MEPITLAAMMMAPPAIVETVEMPEAEMMTNSHDAPRFMRRGSVDMSKPAHRHHVMMRQMRQETPQTEQIGVVRHAGMGFRMSTRRAQPMPQMMQQRATLPMQMMPTESILEEIEMARDDLRQEIEMVTEEGTESTFEYTFRSQDVRDLNDSRNFIQQRYDERSRRSLVPARSLTTTRQQDIYRQSLVDARALQRNTFGGQISEDEALEIIEMINDADTLEAAEMIIEEALNELEAEIEMMEMEEEMNMMDMMMEDAA